MSESRAGAWREPVALLAVAVAVLAWSGIGPADRLTWFLEVAPVLIGIALLLATWRSFPLSPLLCRLLLVHAVILMVGGHYTYAEVPLGDWVKAALDLERNHYDRLGHLAQGFVPAILAREILRRQLPTLPRRWLFLFVTSICLAFSAFYEMIEWWTAVMGGDEAAAFLGTQGDVWDTQWDMFLALVGALAAQLALSRVHDRHLARLEASRAARGGDL